jgi:hypothetical protein
MFGPRIDDLLGSEGDGAPPSRRDSWLREWPLLTGLACSLALIGGAMLVEAPEAPPVEAAKADSAANADYSAGQVVNVGEDEVATTDDEPVAAAKPKKGKAKPKKAKAESAAPDETSAAPAGQQGDAGGSQPRSPSRQPSRTGGAAKPGRIVNVTGTSASITNGPLSYTLKAPTHSPKVGKPWRLTVSVRRNGQPLSGKVKVDILHNGSIVGHAASGPLSGGAFAHDFDWPAESAGHPLTVKTTVIGGGFQQSFLFDVKVTAAG